MGKSYWCCTIFTDTGQCLSWIAKYFYCLKLNCRYLLSLLIFLNYKVEKLMLSNLILSRAVPVSSSAIPDNIQCSLFNCKLSLKIVSSVSTDDAPCYIRMFAYLWPVSYLTPSTTRSHQRHREQKAWTRRRNNINVNSQQLPIAPSSSHPKALDIIYFRMRRFSPLRLSYGPVKSRTSENRSPNKAHFKAEFT